MKKEHHYYVYIMSNYKRTTFYIGFTNKLIRRVIEHKYGMGSVFTRRYRLKYLVYYEQYKYVHDAIFREKELKGWLREKKIELIKSVNPELKDLSQELFDCYEITKEEVEEITKELKEKYKKE